VPSGKQFFFLLCFSLRDFDVTDGYLDGDGRGSLTLFSACVVIAEKRNGRSRRYTRSFIAALQSCKYRENRQIFTADARFE
jgi:hypothetical protein